MATIYDIAAAMNLSASAVSRALRDGEGLSPDTVAAIRAEARRQGYVPRPRKHSPARSVAILCPGVGGGFYSRIVTSLTRHLNAGGCECFTVFSDFDKSREEMLLKMLPERGISGILCITESRDLRGALESCIRTREVPIVQIGMSAPVGEYDNVRVDEETGVRAIMEHLTGLGHRRIVFLGGRFSRTRSEFFLGEAERLGITASCRAEKSGEVGFDCGYHFGEKLLQEKTLPTAIVAEYDDVALGAMRRLQEAGVSIPRDISVVGYDDADYCSYMTPALTTVHSHTDSMCEIASEMLLRKLRDPVYRTVQNILIRPDLVIRESTSKARE